MHEKSGSASNFSIYSILPLVTAIIWGFGFVAQVSGSESVPPVFYNAVRFTLGGLVLIPVALLLDKKDKDFKETLKLAVFGGCILFAAATFQQLGLAYTASAAKGGFITALYAIIVPILEFCFFKKKVSVSLWISVALSIIGCFLIFRGSDTTGESLLHITSGDVLLLVNAVLFAIHIIYVDRVVDKIRSVTYASVQFITVGVFSFIFAFIFEEPSFEAIQKGLIPILYGAFGSCALGFTLQIFAQKSKTPVLTGIMFSTEGMFALLGGALILHEHLSTLSIIGSILILSAVIISEVSKIVKK